MPRNYFSNSTVEFAATLHYISELKKEGDWKKVAEIIGKNLRRLLGAEYNDFVKLTEFEMLARIVRNGATAWVPYKITMLISLLKEAGDFATIEYPPRGGHGWYLKALHILLDCLAHGELRDNSELKPDIETLLNLIGDSPLPITTRLLLMREYERRGCFAKAISEFQSALVRSPQNPLLLDFGIAFFERLNRKSDAILATDGLSRPGVEGFLSQLLAKKGK
jgi:hypothetical protein